MTTDTAALQERIARALAGRWRDMHTNESLGRQRMLAAAVLPIIAAEVQAASEKAWDEGQTSGWDEAQCTWQETGGVGDGWKHSTVPNHYRGEQTNG